MYSTTDVLLEQKGYSHLEEVVKESAPMVASAVWDTRFPISVAVSEEDFFGRVVGHCCYLCHNLDFYTKSRLLRHIKHCHIHHHVMIDNQISILCKLNCSGKNPSGAGHYHCTRCKFSGTSPCRLYQHFKRHKKKGMPIETRGLPGTTSILVDPENGVYVVTDNAGEDNTPLHVVAKENPGSDCVELDSSFLVPQQSINGEDKQSETINVHEKFKEIKSETCEESAWYTVELPSEFVGNSPKRRRIEPSSSGKYWHTVFSGQPLVQDNSTVGNVSQARAAEDSVTGGNVAMILQNIQHRLSSLEKSNKKKIKTKVKLCLEESIHTHENASSSDEAGTSMNSSSGSGKKLENKLNFNTKSVAEYLLNWSLDHRNKVKERDREDIKFLHSMQKYSRQFNRKDHLFYKKRLRFYFLVATRKLKAALNDKSVIDSENFAINEPEHTVSLQAHQVNRKK